ncbi:MAG: PP2C family protein-serine/threonine phosphatase, partial [Myxococcota bacterium]
IDPRSGELECLNAGHPPPLVVDGEGGVRRLQSETNVALGMLEASFVSQQGRLEADETLLLYTDGLFEVNDQDGRPLGMTRFADVVARAVVHQRRRPIAELQRALARELRALRGAQLFADDNTFLFARRA